MICVTGLESLARLHVMGLPAPQGSKTVMRAGGRHVAVESGRAKLDPWRAVVATVAADKCIEVGVLAVPVSVRCTFRLPMPRSRPKYLQAQGEAPHTVKPDLDKLLRGLLDGLVHGGLLRDDSLVCEIHSRKIEVVGWTGADVELFAVPVPTKGRA